MVATPLLLHKVKFRGNDTRYLVITLQISSSHRLVLCLSKSFDSAECGQTCIFGRHRLVSFLRWPPTYPTTVEPLTVERPLALAWHGRAHYQDSALQPACTSRPDCPHKLTQFLPLCSRSRCVLRGYVWQKVQ